ncbi:MAG TPA: hypothetical protein VGS12_06495 [Caulobacteraceae bacterium]|nr:hypothetical protein [Caulobacteraceae bacterium]
MPQSWPRWAAQAGATLFLAACATTTRLGAAEGAHALLVAVRDDDKAAFEAHIDHPALESAVQAKLVGEARQADLPVLLRGAGVLASGPLSRLAVAALIRPEVLRGVAAYYGYRLGQRLPGMIAIAGALETLPGDRVCAVTRRGAPCLVTLADEGGSWRLVDFDLDEAAHLAARSGGRSR